MIDLPATIIVLVMFSFFTGLILCFAWLCVKMDNPTARFPIGRPYTYSPPSAPTSMIYRVYSEDGQVWTDMS